MRKAGLGRGFAALLDNEESQTEGAFEGFEDAAANEAAEAVADAAVANALGADVVAGAGVEAAGLDAAAGVGQGGQEVVKLPLEKLAASPGQPRKNFDEAELKELAASIERHGVIVPILVADAGDGTFIIIAGERRFRAAALAGLKELPAIVRNYTDQKRMEVSLIENIQRADLNPVEEAAAYKNLMDFAGLSQEELAERVGKNRSTVANALRILKLPAEIQKSVESGAVSAGHARALLSVNSQAARDKLYGEILAGAISVREAEKRAALANEKAGKGAGGAAAGAGSAGGASGGKPPGRAPELDAMVEKFINRLGTKVVLDGDMNIGRITIDYYSMEDLERLYEILGG
ncbi:MAG: ParB/RepB/Spo0J family partition protein [Spirochaetes bacterium]|nr:ParB/RepB/Spo0J family partition protein [Spirochaetota bacterium]